MPDKPNIVLITVDSLRADRLGFYSCRRPPSPNIAKFAATATFFSQSYANGPNTPHSFPSIMTSRSALSSRRLGLFDCPVTLAELLQAAGYQTLAFNAGNAYVSRFFDYARGFDQFHDYLDEEVGRKLTSYPKGLSEQSGNAFSGNIRIPELAVENYAVTERVLEAKSQLERGFTEDVMAAIRGVRQPFFLWIHYMDTHYPYVPQARFQTQLGSHVLSSEEMLHLNTRVRENMPGSTATLHRIIRLYEATIRQLDERIGSLLAFLQQQELYDSSLMVFVADHGEEFMEHGDLQHKSKLYDELLHVPLVIKMPNQHRSETRADLCSLQQLAPAILDAVGAENPFPTPGLYGTEAASANVSSSASYYADNLLPVDRMLFNIELLPKVYALRTHRWKIIWHHSKDQWEVYDLVSDPGELKTLESPALQSVVKMKEQLQNSAARLEVERLRSRIRVVRKEFGLNHEQAHAIRTPLRS